MKKGFTLLELIIVIIIVGVLASVALPRFFRVIESARATEALVNISALRQAMERCYIMSGGTTVGCTMAKLSIENPGNSPNAHFSYQVVNGGSLMPAQPGYFSIGAVRTSRDGGPTGGGMSAPVKGIMVPAGVDYVILEQSAGVITIIGSGAFSGVH